LKQEISCGAVVFDGDCVLLIRSNRGGHTAFPKGHMEAGETREQTALREIWEETGLTVALDGDFCFSNAYSPAPDVMKTVYYFAAHPVGGTLLAQEGEVQETFWLKAGDAMERLTYENDKKLLQAALDWKTRI